MHKNLCATFCGKPVESVETVENAIRGSSAASRKVTSCSSYGAPRLTHDLKQKVSKNLLTKRQNHGIIQTEREVRAMKEKSLGHLSSKAAAELFTYEVYDSKKYRYVYKPDEDNVYRIDKELLDTTEALNPENWIKQ